MRAKDESSAARFSLCARCLIHRRRNGVDADEQADLRQHGGSAKAVYAYAAEDLAWRSGQLGRDLGAAAFGENLTTHGLDLRNAVIGEQWCIGSAVLQVSEPRTPCWKLGMRLGDPAFPRAFARGRRAGVLLRVLREGALQSGDVIEVSSVPAHGVTAADVTAMYYGYHVDAARIVAASELAAHWHEWSAHRTIWLSTRSASEPSSEERPRVKVPSSAPARPTPELIDGLLRRRSQLPRRRRPCLASLDLVISVCSPT